MRRGAALVPSPRGRPAARDRRGPGRDAFGLGRRHRFGGGAPRRRGREGTPRGDPVPRLTSEDLFAWRRLLGALGGARIGVRRLARGEDDALLVRADKGANSKGASWILGDDATETAILAAAGRGEVDTLLVAGDPLDPADTAVLEPAARSRVAHVVFVGPFVSGAAAGADVLLPSSAWAEEDGTFVNFEGRVQRVGRCHLPRGEGRPGWRVAADLGLAAGVTMPQWTSADEILATLAAVCKPFEGLTPSAIGLLGVSRG